MRLKEVALAHTQNRHQSSKVKLIIEQICCPDFHQTIIKENLLKHPNIFMSSIMYESILLPDYSLY